MIDIKDTSLRLFLMVLLFELVVWVKLMAGLTIAASILADLQYWLNKKLGRRKYVFTYRFIDLILGNLSWCVNQRIPYLHHRIKELRG